MSSALVKQELSDFGSHDRQARVREMAAKIRAEAKAKAAAKAVGVPTPPAAPPATQDGAPVPPRKRQPAGGDPDKESEDAQKLEGFLPGLEQKVSAAEDEADKVGLLAAPLAMEASEELRSVQTSAVRDTERAVKAALSAISMAKREVDRRLKESEAFSPVVRESAKGELGKLSARLDAAQGKVEEHRNVRRDHEQALAAERLFVELAQRLSSVEIDCEKAAMMSEPLAKVLTSDPETISAHEIRECKEALRVAQATLAPTTRLIAGKVAGLKGTVRKKMQELQERAEASQAILDKAQQTVDEAQSRAAAAPILRAALERLEEVEGYLNEMREAEGPFLMGIEVMPADESAVVLQRMDKAAAAAQAGLADAHKFIGLKMVEIGRFAEGAASSARRELERVKQQIDSGFERVKAFQEESAKRKRQQLVMMVKERIEEAEAGILRLKEAGSELAAAEAAGLPEALDRALATELEAQNLVAAARRELQERTHEMKGGEASGPDAVKHNSEMLRTKVRVNYMEAELSKFRKLAKNYEERIKVGRSLTETSTLLRDVEAEVDRLTEAAASWPQDERPPQEAEKAIAASQSKLSYATTQVDMKLQTAQGLELKELRGIIARLQKMQSKLDAVKDTARQRAKMASSQLVRSAGDAVRRAEAAVATVSSAAASPEVPADRLEDLNRQAREGLALIGAAHRELARGLGDAQQLGLEAKVEFARLQLRCKAIERKGRAVADKLCARYERVASEAETAVRDALREAARVGDDSYDVDKLFLELAAGGSDVSAQQVAELTAKADPPMAADLVALAYKRIAPHGLTRKNFASALADFRRVVREIVLTDGFEIQVAKRLRKLMPGEVLEATGAARTDSALNLQRVQCRVVSDGVVGWVTVGSAGGTVYLERASQPLLWCSQGIAMRQELDEGSAPVQQLQPGDVLEVVQGPMEQRTGSEARVRGVACHEEAVGWLQVRDKTGAALAQLNKHVYRCNEAIAMTDVPDFASCTMVRRIEAGEALELLADEAEVEPTEGGARRKFRACRDGREGWITTRGSQGTVYVRLVPKHYVCLQAAPMHSGLGAESPVVRVLMPGEAFNAFEEPREVSGGECLAMYKVRAASSGAEGWVTSTTRGEVQEWSYRFTVVHAVPLTSALSMNEAVEPFEVHRLLEPGEFLQLSEQPVEDLTSGTLRVRCIAESDAMAGWVTVRENGGLLQVRPLTAEEASAGPAGGAGPGTPTNAAPSTPPAGGRPWVVKEEEGEDARWRSGKAGKGKGKGKGKPKGKW